jgi:hypothetical protein
VISPPACGLGLALERHHQKGRGGFITTTPFLFSRPCIVIPAPDPSRIYGTLTSQRPSDGATRSWAISGDDVLWLGRMLVAEDGAKSASESVEHAYTRGRAMASMILRRLGVTYFAGPYQSTTHLLRGDPSGGSPQGWSSPLRYTQGSESSSAAQTRAWAAIPDYFQRAVLDTVTGRVALIAPHVVDAAEGAACTMNPLPASPNTNRACFTEVRIRDNAPSWRREFPGLTRSWLISTTNSRSWPEENVYIEGGARASSLGGRMTALALPAAMVGAVCLVALLVHVRWGRGG